MPSQKGSSNIRKIHRFRFIQCMCKVSFGHFALCGVEKGLGGGAIFGGSRPFAGIFLESLLKLTFFGGLSKFLVFWGYFKNLD